MDAAGTRYLTGTLYLAEKATGRDVGLDLFLTIIGPGVSVYATDPASGDVVTSTDLPAAIAAFLLASLSALL